MFLMRDLPNVCSDCDATVTGRKRRCEGCARAAEVARAQRTRDARRAAGLPTRNPPSERERAIAQERRARRAAIQQDRRNNDALLEAEWRAGSKARRDADLARMKVARDARAALADARRQAAPRVKSRQERTINRVQSVVRAVLVGRRDRHALLDFLGYDAATLRRHFERQFTVGMSWDALVRAEIHVGHILPASGFDLSCEGEVRAAWSLSNLRPEWALDNWRRGARRDTLI